MYYEIQALLKQNPDLKPVHDEAAAVNYLVFDKDQWVSYDDATTFKQKVDWANEIGIGGSLIWASDTGQYARISSIYTIADAIGLDDDTYSAHKGLTGRTDLAHVDLSAVKAFQSNSLNIALSLQGQLGQDCVIMRDCTDQNNPQASSCGKGAVHVGWERGDCGVSTNSRSSDKS
jgi:chitinase